MWAEKELATAKPGAVLTQKTQTLLQDLDLVLRSCKVISILGCQILAYILSEPRLDFCGGLLRGVWNHVLAVLKHRVTGGQRDIKRVCPLKLLPESEFPKLVF